MLSQHRIATDQPSGDVEIAAADGFRLAALLHDPRAAAATVLVHGATAVPQTYYRRFAAHLAGAGYRVVTYDYRGVGRSRPRSLRGFRASMTGWALDAGAVIDWVKASFPGPLISIGHSFGGQLIGIVDAAHEVDAAILVAAQMGSMWSWPLPARIRLGAIWYLGVPALTAGFGYLPGRAGLGEDLPAGVAREWARWCRSRRYLVDHVPGAAARFARFSAPTLVYRFTDDDMAPAAAVDALVARLRGASVRERRIAPADLAVERIGHFGFFREEMAGRLWPELVRHLDAVVTGGPSLVGEPVAAGWTVTEEELRRDLQYGR